MNEVQAGDPVAPDPLTAALDEIRDRNEWRIEVNRFTEYTVEHDVAEGDVRRLLAALDEVLKLHARQDMPVRSYDLDLRCPIHRPPVAAVPSPPFDEIRDCPDCTDRERHPCIHCPEEDWPCPTVQAISRALPGEEGGDARPDR